ncbi:MAG: hypothetical protein PHF37_02680, partial [Phycisphaerae bacterium]|nr:hypothetical protein [Phycisphaerae bacterium]
DTDTDLDLDMDIDNDTDIDVDTDTDLDLDMDIDNDTDIDVDTDTDDDILLNTFEPMSEKVRSSGCPALVQWAANELGVNPDEIQIFVANSLGSRSDIQPCDTCSKLKVAATILGDSSQRLETLAMVVNQFASPAGPPSDEQMAMIAGMLNSGEGPQYAAAQEWVDALVAYVGILNTDFGYNAEQSVAYAGKYLAPVLEGDNAALMAYVTGLLQNAVQ